MLFARFVRILYHRLATMATYLYAEHDAKVRCSLFMAPSMLTNDTLRSRYCSRFGCLFVGTSGRRLFRLITQRNRHFGWSVLTSLCDLFTVPFRGAELCRLRTRNASGADPDHLISLQFMQIACRSPKSRGAEPRACLGRIENKSAFSLLLITELDISVWLRSDCF